MDERKLQILDITIDTQDPEKGTLEVLTHVKPGWKKEEIITEV